ncbi:guanine nucleotide-binding protein G(I)/G(S)/G(O) subunit gamma-11-like [Styela clava]
MAAQNAEEDEVPEHPMDLMTLNQADTYVEQFRRQLKMHREQVSVVSEAIMNFCVEEMKTDPLIKGMDTKTNPYLEKKECSLI